MFICALGSAPAKPIDGFTMPLLTRSHDSFHPPVASSILRWYPLRKVGKRRDRGDSTTSKAETQSSLLFRMRSSSSLLLLGLLHHGMMRSAGAFPVVIPPIRGTVRGPFANSLVRDHYRSRLNARRNHHTDSEQSVDGTASRKELKKPGWRRRVLSRLRGKSGSLEAVATADETLQSHETVDQFVLENFERLSPEELFSTLENAQYVLDASADACDQTASPFFESPVELQVVATNSSEAFYDFAKQHEDDSQLLLHCIVPSSVIGETSSFEGGPPIRKAVRNWFQNLLTNSFCDWAAEEPVNLQVRCSPTGNVLGQLVRGQLNCNARADFERLVFSFLRLSGGSIEGSRLALNLLAFTVDRSQQPKENIDNRTSRNGPLGMLESKKLLPRYTSQFDLHANDCILTQEDLFESSCVRNGLQNLVKRILKGRAIPTTSVVLEGITIQDGKVCVKGEANVRGVIPTRISFEVRSGIDFTHRGHVLTFPGLELSVSPDAGFFVPIPGVELDIGHNARIREFTLDGDLRVSASVTITPVHTLKLSEAYTQSSQAYSAMFSYDVGRWLTRIGRFSL